MFEEKNIENIVKSNILWLLGMILGLRLNWFKKWKSKGKEEREI